MHYSQTLISSTSEILTPPICSVTLRLSSFSTHRHPPPVHHPSLDLSILHPHLLFSLLFSFSLSPWVIPQPSPLLTIPSTPCPIVLPFLQTQPVPQSALQPFLLFCGIHITEGFWDKSHSPALGFPINEASPSTLLGPQRCMEVHPAMSSSSPE